MLLCISLAVNADAYRCKGGNGQTMISTSPCGDSYSTTKVVGQESSDALALHRLKRIWSGRNGGCSRVSVNSRSTLRNMHLRPPQGASAEELTITPPETEFMHV